MDRSERETKRLRQNVEWALARALDPGTVLPMLHRLSRLAPLGSDESVYAQRRLAELLADHHPWRAALSARRVLAAQPRDDGAWAILAFCHALLRNYRCSVGAYRRALTLSPDNAAYAHNLGHLVDVALGRPKDALPYLRLAYARSPGPDVAVSLAHALGRAGDIAEATQVTKRALATADATYEKEYAALLRWLESGAPDEPQVVPRPPAREMRGSWRRRRAGSVAALEEALAKGLRKLPLDGKQRDRARALVRDPQVGGALLSDRRVTQSVAAAIAYAIVFLDDVPLTQAEVASCFRVSVPALRGQWKALRARTPLLPPGVGLP
jgi:tetratricopeptide (TPR) repeat protein